MLTTVVKVATVKMGGKPQPVSSVNRLGGLALIPVALGMGKPGSEIQAPMALVILCGLLSSTALNMVVVPPHISVSGRRTRAIR